MLHAPLTFIALSIVIMMGCAPRKTNEGAPNNQVGKANKTGGIDGSGGGSLRPESGSAWFLGTNNTIKYCMSSAADFGVEISKVKASLENAFIKWREYAVEKQVDHFASKLQYVDACDGNEDLTVYLGTETQEITEEKKHYNNPVALNMRSQLDLDEGWSKGLIWLAKPYSVDPALKLPDYKSEKRLSGILLHEVGHIFGNGHVKDTIMTPDIDMFMRGDLAESAHLGMIDQNRELSHCITCTKVYDGIVTTQEYEMLVGQSPTGSAKAQLEVRNATYISAATLSLQDESGKKTEFPISIAKQLCPNGGIEVFKMVRKDPNSGGISTYFGDGRSCVYKGILKTLPGKNLPVSINLNMNTFYDVFLNVTYTSETDGKEHTIFTLPVIQ